MLQVPVSISQSWKVKEGGKFFNFFASSKFTKRNCKKNDIRKLHEWLGLETLCLSSWTCPVYVPRTSMWGCTGWKSTHIAPLSVRRMYSGYVGFWNTLISIKDIGKQFIHNLIKSCVYEKILYLSYFYLVIFALSFLVYEYVLLFLNWMCKRLNKRNIHNCLYATGEKKITCEFDKVDQYYLNEQGS